MVVVDFATDGKLYLVSALPKLGNFQIREVSYLDAMQIMTRVHIGSVSDFAGFIY